MIGQPSYGDIARIARDGSPLLLQAIGRVYGFGQGDITSLRGGGVPMWPFVLVAVAAGFVAGARVQKRYGQHLPKILTG